MKKKKNFKLLQEMLAEWQELGKSSRRKTKTKEPTYLKMIFSALILMVVVFVFGIYVLNWSSYTAFTILRVVPFPVALIDYKPLKYADWIANVEALKSYYQQDMDRSQIPTLKSIKHHALERMIENKIIYQESKKYNLNVTDEELDEEFSKLENLNNQNNPGVSLTSLYHMTEDYFKKEILKPLILKKKLTKAIAVDQTANEAALAKVELVKKLLEDPDSNFELLASQYSDDVGSLNNGDIGYFALHELEPEVSAIVQNMSVGEISEPIITKYGFHIIKLKNRISAEGETEQFHLEHLLIRTIDLNDYLSSVKNSKRIIRFVNI